MILEICVGLALASVGAWIVLRITTRSARARVPAGSFVTIAGYASVRVGIITVGSVALIYAFAYTLFPDVFQAFYGARVFWPVTIGIIVSLVLKSLGKTGVRVASLIGVLLVIAVVRELFQHRAESAVAEQLSEDRSTKNSAKLPAINKDSIRAIRLTLKGDSSWSEIIDTENLPTTYYFIDHRNYSIQVCSENREETCTRIFQMGGAYTNIGASRFVRIRSDSVENTVLIKIGERIQPK